MKKLLMMILTCMCMLGVQAQTSVSKNYYVRGGLGLMSIYGEDDDDADFKVGYNAMVGFQRSFGSSNFYWGMEAGLGTRGAKDSDSDMSIIAHRIVFSPFTVAWKPRVAGNTQLELHYGLQASYDYAGRVNWGPVSCNLSEVDDWNKFDLGAEFGVGVWIGHFDVDLAVQAGANKLIKDTDAYSVNALVRVGYSF